MHNCQDNYEIIFALRLVYTWKIIAKRGKRVKGVNDTHTWENSRVLILKNGSILMTKLGPFVTEVSLWQSWPWALVRHKKIKRGLCLFNECSTNSYYYFRRKHKSDPKIVCIFTLKPLHLEPRSNTEQNDWIWSFFILFQGTSGMLNSLAASVSMSILKGSDAAGQLTKWLLSHVNGFIVIGWVKWGWQARGPYWVQ